MRPFFSAVMAQLAIILVVFNSAAAAQNCYDQWVTNNPGATELISCCGDLEVGATLPEALTAMTALKKIILASCNLQGSLPIGLGDMSNLEHLLFRENRQLGGPFPDISKFTLMTHLHLSWSDVTGTLPAKFSSLSAVTDLNLRGNKLTGTLPKALTELSTVARLGLGYNNFTGTMPAALGTMQSLTLLSVEHNQLTGTIPSVLGDLTNLNSIWLTDDQAVHNQNNNNNRFHSGRPNFLDHVTDFDRGNVTTKYDYLAPGVDCASERNMCSLASDACNFLDDRCCVRGGICAKSDCFATWVADNQGATQLTQCCSGQDADNRAIAVTLPNSLTAMASLTKISLSNCGIVGTLPEGLADMEQLKHIQILANGNLGGPFPDIAKFTQMTHLLISWNKVTGPLPSSFLSLAGVTNLNLRGNALTGTLPEALTELASVTRLGLGFNQFSGSIPAVLGDMDTLTQLRVEGNRLTGSIPLSLTRLPNLDEIWLSNQLDTRGQYHNRFHGGRPDFGAGVRVEASADSNFDYLVPDAKCKSPGQDRWCSLASDGCTYFGTCCTPGLICPRQEEDRSCATATTTACPIPGSGQFDCKDAQYCVEGLCGYGQGMCCGSTGIDVECLGEYAKAEFGGLKNWCMVCESNSELGLHRCLPPVTITGRKPPSASHVICESDDADVTDQGSILKAIFFDPDVNIKHLSLRGNEIIGGDIHVLNDKFSGLTHLAVSDNINTFGNLILTTDDHWPHLEFLDVSGMKFTCAGEASACFHNGLATIVPKLRVLHISNMGLTKSRNIEGVASAISLEELYLNDNNLDELPVDFFKFLVKLTKLRIRGNDIPGTLPSYIYKVKGGLDSDVLVDTPIIGTAVPTTSNPTTSPTQFPTGPTKEPTLAPSKSPSKDLPTYFPSAEPTKLPTASKPATLRPTQSPSEASGTSQVSGFPIAVIVGSTVGIWLLGRQI